MKYNQLDLKTDKNSHRVGRGISAGKGKTAGRGTKGQGSRKSGGVRPGFEGGQMPLYMRLPKLRGFKSHRGKPALIKTSQLNELKGATVNATSLHEVGLISSAYDSVKLVHDGPVQAKKTVSLTAASAQAVAALEKAGGSFIKVNRLTRTPKKLPTDKTNAQ